ncbi:MAG: chromosomal replication initiator protein DnaA [Dehalococcoidia bacterium]|nr:chromosomal replication initiator protein DnaA [Dehalococcoidia bacterium]
MGGCAGTVADATWLKHTSGLAYADGEFVVGTPNAFVAEMLEQRMYSLIAQTVEGVVEAEVEVRFAVESAWAPSGESGDPGVGTGHPHPRIEYGAGSNPLPQERWVEGGLSPPALNSRYTFDSFVVGKSNEFAHAAALGVARQPGQLYNPLVMYSDVGLGKTHLMHAIGHQVAARGMSLIYSTTEEFTNSFIRAIRDGTTDEFRDYYRTADVLLLDDIQFLIGKDQTQEGFFHTFNALHQTNRQIVVTSDRPVSALALLEDRIQSRLAGGLVVDIQPPDIETRIAILRAKADGSQQAVSDDVLLYLAERIHKNIRELEGGLNKVLAFADLMGTAVTVDLVKSALTDVVETAAERQIPDSVVVETVASYFGVDIATLKGRKRDKKTAKARQVAMYLLREESQLGLATIGQVLGGKDHTTVRHGCDRITNQLSVDASLRRDVINIRETLAAS